MGRCVCACAQQAAINGVPRPAHCVEVHALWRILSLPVCLWMGPFGHTHFLVLGPKKERVSVPVTVPLAGGRRPSAAFPLPSCAHADMPAALFMIPYVLHFVCCRVGQWVRHAPALVFFAHCMPWRRYRPHTHGELHGALPRVALVASPNWQAKETACNLQPGR